MFRPGLLAWALVGLVAAQHAAANGLEVFARYLEQTPSARASFVQISQHPGRLSDAGERTTVTRRAAGRIEFRRPNQFKLTYSKPHLQEIVSDGRTLWVHDPDLGQTSRYPLQQQIGQMPLALLAATSVQDLERHFQIQESSVRDPQGLTWLRVIPRQKDGLLQELRLGFQDLQGRMQPRKLEFIQSQGDKVQVIFETFESPVTYSAGHFAR